MQMVAGRASRRTHAGNQFAALNALAGLNEDGRQMAVAGLNSPTMIKFDQIAIAGRAAGAPDKTKPAPRPDEPSAKTTVGTVWLPPLTLMT